MIPAVSSVARRYLQMIQVDVSDQQPADALQQNLNQSNQEPSASLESSRVANDFGSKTDFNQPSSDSSFANSTKPNAFDRTEFFCGANQVDYQFNCFNPLINIQTPKMCLGKPLPDENCMSSPDRHSISLLTIENSPNVKSTVPSLVNNCPSLLTNRKHVNPVKFDNTFASTGGSSELGPSTTVEMFNNKTNQGNSIAKLFTDVEDNEESDDDFYDTKNKVQLEDSIAVDESWSKECKHESSHLFSSDQRSFSPETSKNPQPTTNLPIKHCISPLSKQRRTATVMLENFFVKPNDSFNTESIFRESKASNAEIHGDQFTQAKLEAEDPRNAGDTNMTFICLSDGESLLCSDVEMSMQPEKTREPNETNLQPQEDLWATFGFEIPVRCRDKILEKSFLQKQKININTYYEERPSKTPQVKNVFEIGCPETEEDFEAIMIGMTTLTYIDVDTVQALGDPNETICDDDEEENIEGQFKEIDIDDEVSFKEQRLNSSTPTKSCPRRRLSGEPTKNLEKLQKSFQASTNSSQKFENVAIEAGEPATSQPRILSEDSPVAANQYQIEKRLSDSERKSPAKNQIDRIWCPSWLDTKSQEKNSVHEPHLSQSARQLNFSQSPSQATNHESIINDMGNEEVDEFFRNYGMRDLSPVKDPQNNFHGFTAQQQRSVKNCNQVIVKDTLNKMLEENTQTEKNGNVLKKIENIFISLLESMSEGQPMTLRVPTVRNWKDVTMSQEILTQKEPTTVKTINHSSKGSERSFTIIVVILSEVFKMLTRNSTCTKRELYYHDVDLFENQESVNKAIDSICAMLDVQEYELGVLTSSKGLVAGDLIIRIDDEVIDCTIPCSVPQNPSAITSLESNADYILVVEKDTVFQRLISEKIFARIEEKIVLITAKGYPDVNTRILLKKIADDLKKPIYILVDSDPHGIEIMMTYKYGSMMKIHNSKYLAVPSIEWIGIHPTDLAHLDNTLTLEITDKDLKKIGELLERPYINAMLKRELNCFKSTRLKAEIESLYSFSINNLINDYIPRKIRTIETPSL